MIKKLMRFWSEERSLTTLLVLLAINLFILAPMIREGVGTTLMKDTFFPLLLLAGLLTMTGHKRLQTVPSCRSRDDHRSLGPYCFRHGGALRLGCPAFDVIPMCIHDGRFVAGDQNLVTGHRVRGAVAGYLLLGLSCAYAYALIDFVIPGAFQMPATDLQSRKAHFDAFLYFSIVTLTTLGYGDITAVHPVARSVVMIEALLGQLYPAILIARLVTLQMEARKNKQ